MDIEKLIEQFRTAADKWEAEHQIILTGELRVQDALREAATALSTLRAENKKLRAELEQKSKLLAQQAAELERRDKLLKEQETELERVKRERSAAVDDLETIMFVGGQNTDTCMYFKKRAVLWPWRLAAMQPAMARPTEKED